MFKWPFSEDFQTTLKKYAPCIGNWALLMLYVANCILKGISSWTGDDAEPDYATDKLVFYLGCTEMLVNCLIAVIAFLVCEFSETIYRHYSNIDKVMFIPFFMLLIFDT
eukprot:UN01303